MADNNTVLGISQDASPDQVQTAFDNKRAAIIASVENEQERADALAELQRAYDESVKMHSLALVDQAETPKPIDPLLSMVSDLDGSIKLEPDHFATVACVHCGARNPQNALTCTNCGRQFQRPCPKCGKIQRIDVTVCSRCNTVIREYDQTRLIESEQTLQVKDRERVENQIRVNALEEHHQQRAVFGVSFWIIVVAVIVGICVLLYFLAR